MKSWLRDIGIACLCSAAFILVFKVAFLEDAQQRDERIERDNELYEACSRHNGKGSIVLSDSRIIKCEVR